MAQNSEPAVSIWLTIAEFCKDYILFPFSNISFVNVVDIFVLAFFIYMIYKFIRDRHAGRAVIGVCLLMLLYALSDIFDMVAVKSILENFYTVGIVALVVLFQPELRDVLERFGTTTSVNFKRLAQRQTTDDEKTLGMIDEICNAVDDLSLRKEGALIVIERDDRLTNLMSEGTLIDSIVSKNLLCNIFVNKSPLHDGAVIIRDGRIVRASSKSIAIAEKIPGGEGLGTRHRAAYKICEVSDAVVIVVSEESGTVSVANNKLLKRGYKNSNSEAENNNFNLRDDLFKFLTGKTIAEMQVQPIMIPKKKRSKKEKGNDGKKGGEEQQ